MNKKITTNDIKINKGSVSETFLKWAKKANKDGKTLFKIRKTDRMFLVEKLGKVNN